MRRCVRVAMVLSSMIVAAIVLRAALPATQTGKWQAVGSMADANSGSAAVMLQDGSVLITGGAGASGTLASAQIFGADGSFASAGNMNEPRSRHTAVALGDGRVLVAGGTTAAGPTNSAEIYDPAAKTWTLTASTMTSARSGHTATLLADGRVLLAGGTTSSGATATMEIFDPSTGQFSPAGVSMSSPRANHAAALLSDGRVLLIGGSDGANALASVDSFDPAAGTIVAAAPLSTPRNQATATTLLNGNVAVIGGNNGQADQASAEIYNASSGSWSVVAGGAPRSGHIALLLKDNNSVLVFGGSSAQDNSADLFTQNAGTGAASFVSTGASATSHAGGIGSAMGAPGMVLGAGGSAGAGAELYGFATVKTDAADYPPGTNVNISGSGFQPGEPVTITLVESPLLDTHGPYTVTADSFGNIHDNSFTTDIHDLDIRFYMTAQGQSSGFVAQNTFTDAAQTSVQSVAAGSQSPNPVIAGGSATFNPVTVTYKVTGSGGGPGPSCTANLSVTGLPGTATAVFGSSSLTSTGSPQSTTLSINTGSTAAGSYPFTLTATAGSGCNASSASTSGTLVIAGTATHFSVTGFPSPATAGTPGTFTVTALDSNNATAASYTGTVTFSSSDAQAVFSPASYTFVAGDNGVHTFASGATLKTAGTQSITATDGAKTGSQTGIVVNAGTASKLAFVQQPSNTALDAAISPAPSVQIQDAFGNNRSDNGTGITVGISSPGTFDGASTLTVNSASGVSTFTNLKPNKVGTGYTLSATSGSLTAATSGAFDVGKATPAFSNIAASQSITYGAATITVSGKVSTTGLTVFPSGNVSITVDGAPAGSAAINTADGTFSTTIDTHAVPVTGSPFTITYAYAGDANFNAATSDTGTTLTVNKKPLTVTGITANNKVYDGTTTATLNTGAAALVGVINSDVVTLDTSATSGAFADKNVATGKTVTVSGLTIGGTGAGNYSLAQPTTTADITAKFLTVTGEVAANKPYDGTTAATVNFTAANLVGVVGSEHVNLNSGNYTSTFDTKDAGNGKTVTILGLKLSGPDAANYDITQPTTTANITPATLSAALTGTITKVYDGNTNATLTPANFSLTGLASGENFTVTKNTGTYNSKDVAAATTVTASLAGGDFTPVGSTLASNYTLPTSASGAGSITKANATVSVTPYAVTYDGDPHTATGSVKGVQNEPLTGLDLSGTTHTTAGSYGTDPWTFTDSTGNYNNANGTVSDSIAKANATVNVTPYTVTYDANAHTATGTATGVKSEALAGIVLTGTTHTDAGDYPGDTWSFHDAGGNYNDANGTVHDSIAKANATITVTGYSTTYDGNAHTASGTATGVGGANLIAGLNLSGTTRTNAGDYLADAWSFHDAGGNYNDASGTVHDAIAKANATINVTAYSVTYDGHAHTATGTATGVNSTDLSSSLNLSGTTHTGAGDYGTDAWSFHEASGNYNDANGTVHDSIAKANVSVVFSNIGPFTYNAAPQKPAFAVNGVNGEVLTGSATASYGGAQFDGAPYASTSAPTNAGNYIQTVAFAENSNYNALSPSATQGFTINPANQALLSVTGPASVTYGATGTATASGGSGTGALTFAHGASTGCSVSGTTVSVSDAGGTCSLTVTKAADNNYYSTTSAAFPVALVKANAVIVVDGYSGTYDGNPHGATGSATGVETPTGANLNSLLHLGSSFTNVPGGTANWTFDGNNNYNNASGSVAMAIAKANATINVTPYSVTYDATSYTATGSANGVKGETLSGLVLTGTTHRDAATYAADPWTFTDSTGNYNDSSGAVSDSIAQAPLSITAFTNSKPYDGNTSASATPTVSGLKGSDTATGLAETYDTRNAGTGKTLSVSAYTVNDGNSGNNYAVTTHSVSTGSISALPITVTAKTDTKIYDGNTGSSPTPTITVGGLISPDTASFTQAFDLKNAGPRTLIASGSVSDGNSGHNYAVTFQSVAGSITQRSLTVSAAGIDKVYDGTTSATVLLSDDRISGDTVSDAYTSASFADKNVGTNKQVSVSGISISGSDALNYALQNTTASTTANITARPLTVAAAGVNKVYDGNTDATVVLSDNRLDGDAAAFTVGYTASFTTPDVGNGKTVNVGLTLPSGTNYALATGAIVTSANITTRPLTVTIDTPTSPSPQGIVNFSAKFSGGVASDTYKATWYFDNAIQAPYSCGAQGTASGCSPTTVTPDGNGGGTVNTGFNFTNTGVYLITLVITDNSGSCSYTASNNLTLGAATCTGNDVGISNKMANGLPAYEVIYDPNAGFVTGGGWIYSGTGSYWPDGATPSSLQGQASFGFVSKYQKGANAPTGQTEFNFQVANMNFHSTSYQWLVVSGALAQYKGQGTINGKNAPGGLPYNFILTGRDGSLKNTPTPDGFRIQITDSTGTIIYYDNLRGNDGTMSDANVQPLTGTSGSGSVVIHSK